jgi:hypothetical protein
MPADRSHVKKEVKRMKYTLMHKNIEVVELEIAEAATAITDIGVVYNPKHVPLGVQAVKGGIDIEELNDWLKGRSIPASRAGIWNLYMYLGRNSTEYLTLKCYGLSLSDHYWIRPAGSGLIWADINFFQNDFSKDVGEMLFGRTPADGKNINLVSPDNTSEGRLRKKWVVANGKRLLIKGGNDPWKQEPYNEVIASAIMKRLGIAHVPYSLMFEEAEPYSVCENFLSVDTELVPAWKVFHSTTMNDGAYDYSHLLRCCDLLGIPNVRPALDRILTLDYIIANEDRHYNNFGFVRNAETLKWLGVAPVFDCGTSLWHNVVDVGMTRKSQPFETTHDEQIKLVSDLSWFNYGALDGIKDECAEILSKSRDIDAERRDKIAEAVEQRCRQIEHLREKPAARNAPAAEKPSIA